MASPTHAAPNRIISLLPSATEILFALGLGDAVVGVTFECNYPTEARSRRIVSTSALPEGLTPAEIDKIVSERMAAGEDLYRLDRGAFADLDPQLVVTQDLCAVCAVDVSEVDDALAFLGCQAEVLTLDPMTLNDVIETVAVTGNATGTTATADKLVADLHKRLETLETRIAERSATPSVLVIEWIEPAFTAGHWVPDMVTAAGGTPVLSFPGERSRPVEWDDIAASAADVVIVTPCGFDLDGSAAQAKQLVEAGRLPAGAQVWAVDADAYVVRPGPRLVDGAEIFASILHPDIAGLPNPAAAVQVGTAS